MPAPFTPGTWPCRKPQTEMHIMDERKSKPEGYRLCIVLLAVNVLSLVFLDLVVHETFPPLYMAKRVLVLGAWFAGFFALAAFLFAVVSRDFKKSLSEGKPQAVILVCVAWWVLSLFYYLFFYFTLSQYKSVLDKSAAVYIALCIIGGALLLFLVYRVLKNRFVMNRPLPYLASLPFVLLLPVVYIAGAHQGHSVYLMIVHTYLSAGAGVLLFAVLFMLDRGGVSPRKSEYIGMGTALLFAASAASFSLEKAEEFELKYKVSTRKNVIILSVDTLREDVLGCYGSREGLTPAIDGLAGDGIVFHNAYSPSPWTLPSFGTVFTGLYPSVHGGGRLEPGEEMEDARPASSRVTYLTRILRDAGYNTVGFYTNSWLSPYQNIDKGFQTYIKHDVDKLETYDVFHPLTAFPYFCRVLSKDLDPPAFNLEDPQQKWIMYRHEEPLFLWIHYLDPHLPYKMHPELEGFYKGFSKAEKEVAEKINRSWLKSLKPGEQPGRETLYRLYQGEVRYTDIRLARIIELLKRTGIYEDSLIVFLADHGEEFWEHRKIGHGHSQYNELIRVPLIIKLPGNRHAGTTVESSAGLVDLAPTVLDYLGIKYEGKMQGISLFDPVRKKDGGSPVTYFSEYTLYGPEEQAVMDDYRKLILRKGKPRLYFNLETDPAEKKNLLRTSPDEANDLYDQYREWEKSSGKLQNLLIGDHREKPRQWGPEEKRRLQALGYLE